MNTGLSARFSLSESIALAAQVDYFGIGDMKIENENRVIATSRRVDNVSQSGINATIGIAYQFGK